MPLKSMTEYELLVKKVNEWDIKYYIQDNPEVSDGMYDKAMRDLLAFEEKNPSANAFINSPTKKIGCSMVMSKLTKISRNHKMMSLANAFTETDIQKFFEDTNSPEYCVEWKYDGLGIELVYDLGILIQATTRGDGIVGEDVLHTVKLMKNVPLTIPLHKPCIVRGEAVVSKKVFASANKDIQQYSSPRNMVAGITRSLDNSKMQQYPAIFQPYEVFIDAVKHGTQTQNLDFLEKHLGFFPINYHCIRGNNILTDCYQVYNDFLQKRASFFFDVDGIVIKVNDQQQAIALGYTAKFPKSAIAWKFPTMAVKTKVKKIMDQVGRTGAVTPVAIFDPSVIIDGVEVTRATGHNYTEMARLGIGVGAEVMVTRNGGVVPGIAEVITPAKKVHKAPRCCPSCGALLRQTQIIVSCEDPGCFAVNAQQLEHFASRNCMDIQGMGEKTAELFTRKLGIFILRFCDPLVWQHEYPTIEGVIGKARTKQIHTSLMDRWRNGWPFHKMIYALGLPDVGEQRSKLLADKFEPAALLKATPEQLLQVEDFGVIVAEAVAGFLWENKQDISRIFDWIAPVNKKLEKISEKLSGKHICITGVLSQPRKMFETHITQNGGIIQSTVTRKTDFLILGDSPGKDKVSKANALEVRTIKEKDFLELLK